MKKAKDGQLVEQWSQLNRHASRMKLKSAHKVSLALVGCRATHSQSLSTSSIV
jgi:hypothetical protein